jgi:hypothetical protein
LLKTRLAKNPTTITAPIRISRPFERAISPRRGCSPSPDGDDPLPVEGHGEPIGRCDSSTTRSPSGCCWSLGGGAALRSSCARCGTPGGCGPGIASGALRHLPLPGVGDLGGRKRALICRQARAAGRSTRRFGLASVRRFGQGEPTTPAGREALLDLVVARSPVSR